MRRARGDCGGPFTRDLLTEYPLHEDTDDDGTLLREGAWLDGGRVVLSADSACSRLEDGAFTSCPVAASRQPWVAHVIRSWRYFEKGQLATIEPEPSAALLECLDAVGGAVVAVEEYERSRRG